MGSPRSGNPSVYVNRNGWVVEDDQPILHARRITPHLGIILAPPRGEIQSRRCAYRSLILTNQSVNRANAPRTLQLAMRQTKQICAHWDKLAKAMLHSGCIRCAKTTGEFCATDQKPEENNGRRP